MLPDEGTNTWLVPGLALIWEKTAAQVSELRLLHTPSENWSMQNK